MDLSKLNFGLMDQEEDDRDYTAEMLGISPDNGTDTIMIDVPNYRYDQSADGGLMMCVPNSLAMGASILNKTEDGEYLKFSRGYLYSIKETNGEGSTMRGMLNKMCYKGICLESLMNVQGSFEECKQVYEQHKHEADFSAHTGKMSMYYRVKTEGDIRKALKDGLPVYISYDVYPNCFPDSNGIVPLPEGDKLGGHCSMIRGHKPGYVRVVNTWGSDWGNNGEAWLPYEMVNLAYVGVDYDTSVKYVYFLADKDYYIKNGTKHYMTGINAQGEEVSVYTKITDGRMVAPVKYLCDAFNITLLEYYAQHKAAFFSDVGGERK